jgi:Tfp pilus assembly protein PilX
VRRLRCENGMTLVISLGFLVVLTIMGTTLATYSSTNARSSQRDRRTVEVSAAAEGGVNRALAVLYNSFQPSTPTALPSSAAPRTETIGGATVVWYGTLSGTTWTITSRASVPNPAVPGGTLSKTTTRLVTVQGLTTGANTSAWSRIYHDDTTNCLTVPTGTTIAGNVASRGNLCLTGTGRITGSSTQVAVGGNVTLQSSSTIGVSGGSVARADVAGTCTWSTGAAHTPCGTSDRVYATTVTTSPGSLVKPGVDFAYWYLNAKPGPKYPCTTTSGSPPAFDNDTTYNGTQSAKELTPDNSSYTCQRWEGGVKVGELSWNHTTRSLTIQGTVFFDGDAEFHDHDTYTRYFGRGTIYIAGNWHNDEVVCAGGQSSSSWSYSGSNCRSGMSNWDPTQNLLVLIIGDKNASGAKDFDFHRGAAFQGVIWSKNKCSLGDTAQMSGPLVCTRIDLEDTSGGRDGWSGSPTLNSWPPLGAPLPGQSYGATTTSTDFMLGNSTQSE